MSIATETRKKVSEGARFSIDFVTRTMKVNGKTVIDHGKYEGILWYDSTTCLMDVMGVLEYLYERYKHSRPSERSESRSRNYFTALMEKDLDDDDMLYGIPREEARFMLEFSVLAYILTGKLKWQERWGNWFWQSKNDKDFIILRKWVDGE